MTLGEVLHYIVIGNPVSSALINTTSSLLSKGGGKHFRLNNVREMFVFLMKMLFSFLFSSFNLHL